jgi:hypothetical protein
MATAGLEVQIMDGAKTSRTQKPGLNRSGMRIARASDAFLLLGFLSLPTNAAFCNVFWGAALFFGLLSLVTASRKPRQKRWFVPGTIGVVLPALAIIFLGPSTYPSQMRVKIPQVNYVDGPLTQILQDFCKQAEKQKHPVSFALHEEELRDQKVTFRTTRPMRLKKALLKLTKAARCSFRYGICAVGNAVILGPIRIFRDHAFKESGEGQLLLRTQLSRHLVRVVI